MLRGDSYIISWRGSSFLFSDCPALSDPANGNRLSNDVSQESVVGFACNGGYTLFGDSDLTCQTDSTWDYDIPVCLKGTVKGAMQTF